jgi:hypothetical protein
MALFNRGLNDELLHVLLDLRAPDSLKDYPPHLHFEPVRGVARLLDSTKALHAAGALIVAHAGSVARKEFVDAPVPLTVGGSRVKAKGEVLFAWALPVAGDMTAQPAEAAPAEGRGGLIENGGLPPGRNPRNLPQPEVP